MKPSSHSSSVVQPIVVGMQVPQRPAPDGGSDMHCPPCAQSCRVRQDGYSMGAFPSGPSGQAPPPEPLSSEPPLLSEPPLVAPPVCEPPVDDPPELAPPELAPPDAAPPLAPSSPVPVVPPQPAKPSRRRAAPTCAKNRTRLSWWARRKPEIRSMR